MFGFLNLEHTNYVIAALTFASGYSEFAARFIDNGTLIVPVSCAVGAAAGSVVSDLRFSPGSMSAQFVKPAVTYAFHSFVWSLIGQFIIIQLNLPNPLLLTVVCGTIGAANAGQSFYDPLRMV